MYMGEYMDMYDSFFLMEWKGAAEFSDISTVGFWNSKFNATLSQNMKRDRAGTEVVPLL